MSAVPLPVRHARPVPGRAEARPRGPAESAASPGRRAAAAGRGAAATALHRHRRAGRAARRRLPAGASLRDPRPRLLGPHRRSPRAPRPDDARGRPRRARGPARPLRPRLGRRRGHGPLASPVAARPALRAGGGGGEDARRRHGGGGDARRARFSSTWWRSTSPAPTTSAAACPPRPGCACSAWWKARRRPSCSWPTATWPAVPGAGRSPSSRPALRWSGPPGPARLLEALAARARAGRHGLRTADLAFAAL